MTARPLVDERLWQCSACRYVHAGHWLRTCPSCGRRDYLCGSVNPHIAVMQAPCEYVDGRWVRSGEGEPDAVVTYSTEPSPETGHVGWMWWARGRMGEAPTYTAARAAAEQALLRERTK